jgi:predicted transcriptional regulator
MVPDIIAKYSQEDRLSADEYIEILCELGGDATTREIAEAAGREQETVSRTLGKQIDVGCVEEFNGVTVKKVARGSTHVYKVLDEPEPETGEQGGEDGV